MAKGRVNKKRRVFEKGKYYTAIWADEPVIIQAVNAYDFHIHGSSSLYTQNNFEFISEDPLNIEMPKIRLKEGYYSGSLGIQLKEIFHTNDGNCFTRCNDINPYYAEEIANLEYLDLEGWQIGEIK